jgi:hypothetical protein
LSVAESVPTSLASKLIVIMQLLPAASVPGHPFVNLNTLRLVPAPGVTDTLLIFAEAPPVLLTVTLVDCV